MAQELVLSATCSGCGSTGDLYGSNCRHMTLCLACGKRLAESKAPCAQCGVAITRLIQEYSLRPHAVSKQYFVGRFLQGLPLFSKKNRWTMQREGLQTRQPTEALREKYKGKPWVLEDDIGVQQFQGQLEGGQQATYYMLIPHGKDIMAAQINSWYNYHKVANYKQLTLEEAEEQMRNRRKTADGYQRWLMKAASTGAAAFSDMESIGGTGARSKGGDDDENGESDRGEEDEDEEARKNRAGTNKGAQTGDEDGEEPARQADADEDEPEKGDDWEHEENFTDDDEAVGNDAEERDDMNAEVPEPRELKQEEEDEAEGEEGDREEGGGLSKSGKELKKLLGKAGGLDESEGDEEEEDDDGDLETEEIGLSPVLLPSKKDSVKEEVSKASSTKVSAPNSAAARAPPVPAGKGKRKSIGDEGKPSVPSSKKAKTEQPPAAKATAASAKKESPAKPSAATTGQAKGLATNGKAAAQAGVSEEEVKNILRQSGPIKSQELVAKFRNRLKTPEDKSSFAAILKKISRIQKTDNINYIALLATEASVKESPAKPSEATPAQAKRSATDGKAAAQAGISEEELKNILRQNEPIERKELVAKFRNRLKTPEDKSAFLAMMKNISGIQRTDNTQYLVLRRSSNI